MNLIIDIGNTRAKVGLFNGDEPVTSVSFDELTNQDILALKKKILR